MNGFRSNLIIKKNVLTMAFFFFLIFINGPSQMAADCRYYNSKHMRHAFSHELVCKFRPALCHNDPCMKPFKLSAK